MPPSTTARATGPATGPATAPASPATSATSAASAASFPATSAAAAAPSLPVRARDLARAQITAEILQTARAHLARDGASGLSLRAVARDLGMASSAVYRYVPSRDDLLTRLITSAYDSLGAVAEEAEGRVDRADLAGRFAAVGHALRDWARQHPHEYALIYGSPVPGYQAPEDTIAPATRVPALLLGILADTPAVPAGPRPDDKDGSLTTALAPLLAGPAAGIPAPLLARGLLCWAGLLGAVSLELFGHLHNVVADDPPARTAYFEDVLERLVAQLGIARGTG